MAAAFERCELIEPRATPSMALLAVTLSTLCEPATGEQESRRDLISVSGRQSRPGDAVNHSGELAQMIEFRAGTSIWITAQCDLHTSRLSCGCGKSYRLWEYGAIAGAGNVLQSFTPPVVFKDIQSRNHDRVLLHM